MRSWKKMSVGLKLAVGATAILALSIVGVLANERFNGANEDVQARETGSPDAEEPAKPAGKPLELGTVAKISANYSVAVEELTVYEVSSSQVMVATIKAKYIGKEDGEPWADLSADFSKEDSRTYGEAECPIDLGDKDASDQATLKPDEETTYAVCLDLPDGDIKGGRVSVEEAFSDQEGKSWSVEEAVTKQAPSAAPASPGDRAAGTRSRPSRQSDNDDDSRKTCEDFDEDKYERYKDWGEGMKEYFEKRKDAGDLDDDELDDFEEWENAYDKQIDLFERWRDAC